MSSVPLIDLAPWSQGDAAGKAGVAARVDSALRDSGFLLITGHGVADDLRSRMRSLSREFFALPEEAKARYAVTVGGRGWLPPGVEANGYAEGTETPPDLKESYSAGAEDGVGVPEVDSFWFQPNVWPGEVAGFAAAAREYMTRMRSLSDELLTIFAAALGLEPTYFTRHTGHPTYTFNINWYPPITRVGAPRDGQFRIGPHTDFGTVTVLDRQAGAGGLQVYTGDGEWVDAPFEAGAFTINIGDLMARWTGDRWRSTRHRVLPPDPSAPDEDLVSLIFFYETDHDARISSLAPPRGRHGYPDVIASEYLREKLDAITVGRPSTLHPDPARREQR
ncbi:MAG TPA: 2-oxoglutarate and iron-dependent oxygenase domain-containing protein [Amycolatopsis sp.]|uniref:isopenicillin N synthase family dioxygenase n=1 Tax=Amycolatopsis sp. TaxID=37632 RepID=UPI002B4905C7|nr:2-oxoglutarate and iron-dependent oxygenase domain-containing protein [Amycolatopsis sp.]HKS49944.1 2-oxoglutarate and iron-dependent oxygenase domain-containing protein [Amycolatopsis sp.]